MDPVTVVFGLACIGAGGGAGFWLKKADARLQKLSDKAIVLQEGQAAHFSHLNTEVNNLRAEVSQMNGLVNSLRATHPEIDGALLVHSAINNFESSSPKDTLNLRSETISALETILSTISTEAEIGGEGILPPRPSDFLADCLTCLNKEIFR